MKRKLTALLLVLLLAVTLVTPALATGSWIRDDAGLLTANETAVLAQQAQQLADTYGVGVYIRTVDDYADDGFSDVETASYTLYHDDALGVGDGRDGILLLLSMSSREYATFVYGDTAEPIFPSAALQRLEDDFLDDFRDDDWYDGFSDYIDGCADILSGDASDAGSGGYVYDTTDADSDTGEVFPFRLLARNFVIALALSCVIALLVCLILKMRMRSVRRQTEARAYVTPEGLHLTRRDDIYTHTTVTRHKIERGNDRSGSGADFSGGGGHGRSGSF